MRYSGPRQLLLTLAIPKSAMADPVSPEGRENTMAATLGHRRELCFWGWGYADAGLTDAEQAHVQNWPASWGRRSLLVRLPGWRTSIWRPAHRRARGAAIHPVPYTL